MHFVDVCTGLQLYSMGKVAHSVPFKRRNVNMTLYKGKDALDVRRDVAMKLTPSLIKDLRKPRRLDKPDWGAMQQLHDAGLSNDPVSGQPVINPSACAPELLNALWRTYCGVADTINTGGHLRKTSEALDELDSQLHEHTARLKRERRGAPANKHSEPAPSLSDEGTDTGEPPASHRPRKRRKMIEAEEGSMPYFDNFGF